jgi:hypothetical protein
MARKLDPAVAARAHAALGAALLGAGDRDSARKELLAARAILSSMGPAGARRLAELDRVLRK